ncbi:MULTISPECIES: 50S ribosomal protein L25/general stress protein Ctc [unclassified Nostoc]|uniref:50S ribosomal protein L25/general stress protein Ctc n=1 Tax=unclassified Nostoc TaxID=2593658 RepID=UPI002AD1E4CB|nr:MULTISPECIES: 50S ribosomal protein L25/general stress protein Ctc [unclassified Nostoc]MDZ8031203.1 50S ribosomal protein L25/general stress protein Ctc [Nostoc sp. DedSLP04]MDZ8132661.1 50S ribosomal protein L25/general stress protein Ctc [Nostoc sp. DedQUE07]MDZ8137351.1 50S ribosomal protein L25/general stress protein Ctc [Nostoc sp. DedQUE04]
MAITVESQKRPEGSKPKALRRAGLIPANLYGHKGTESISLTIEAKTVERLLKRASVNNTLIELNIADAPWRGKTLLRELQIHPAKGTPYHLSFFAVAGHGDTTVEVPLRYVGTAVGVKQEGGFLDTVITELQVSCAPENIPEIIEIDVSNLQIGDSLRVHELVLPQGVTVLGDTERVVVSVSQPQISAAAEDEAEAGSETTSEAT